MHFPFDLTTMFSTSWRSSTANAEDVLSANFFKRDAIQMIVQTFNTLFKPAIIKCIQYDYTEYLILYFQKMRFIFGEYRERVVV